MASALDIIQAGNPPRTTFLDYPLGHSAGKPFDAEDQLAVVRTAVLGLEGAAPHDAIQMLPNSWSSDESWKQHAANTSLGDSRQPRDETPRFQSEEDRKLAVASGALA